MKTIRNETDRSSLIERLSKLKGDEKPVWGRMSIEQMMSHLVQACDLPFESSVPDRSTVMSRTFVKPLVLYVLPIPKEVKVSAEMDQQADGRPPLGFETDRDLVIAGIDRLANLSVDHKCLAHPFFGKMSAKEWAVIGYKHTDHHLNQFGV
ncbi:MAG: DUF1569 domain-containing protein [Pyrinomonadaceae bacterium]